MVFETAAVFKFKIDLKIIFLKDENRQVTVTHQNRKQFFIQGLERKNNIQPNMIFPLQIYNSNYLSCNEFF